MADLIDLRDAMRTFSADRDWSRFHDPKSLVLALVGEVGELAEVFQWVSADLALEAAQGELREAAHHEVADVLLYLVRLADVLNIDLAQAAQDKLLLNAVKHPVPGKPRS